MIRLPPNYHYMANWAVYHWGVNPSVATPLIPPASRAPLMEVIGHPLAAEANLLSDAVVSSILLTCRASHTQLNITMTAIINFVLIIIILSKYIPQKTPQKILLE